MPKIDKSSTSSRARKLSVKAMEAADAAQSTRATAKPAAKPAAKPGEVARLLEALRLAQERESAASKQAAEMQASHAVVIGELQGQQSLVEHLQNQAKDHGAQLATAEQQAASRLRDVQVAADAQHEVDKKAAEAAAKRLEDLQVETHHMISEQRSRIVLARNEGRNEGRERGLAEGRAEAPAAAPAAAPVAALVAALVAAPVAARAPTAQSQAERKRKERPRVGETVPGRYQRGPPVSKDAFRTADRDFASVPFFEALEITDAADLQDKLTEYDIAQKTASGESLDATQRKNLRNQTKYKADGFVALLWLESQDHWEPGNVAQLFAFIMSDAHQDQGNGRKFFNHNHRVCTYMWPDKVSTYESFKATANKSYARQARSVLTGVRLAHKLYETHTGKKDWPVGEDPAAASSAEEDAPRLPRLQTNAAPTPRARSARKQHKQHKRRKVAAEEPEFSEGDDSESSAFSVADGESDGPGTPSASEDEDEDADADADEEDADADSETTSAAAAAFAQDGFD